MGDAVVGLGGSFVSMLAGFSPFTYEVPCTFVVTDVVGGGRFRYTFGSERPAVCLRTAPLPLVSVHGAGRLARVVWSGGAFGSREIASLGCASALAVVARPWSAAHSFDAWHLPFGWCRLAGRRPEGRGESG